VSRPSLEEMYLEIAGVVAKRATCSRLKVGAVITNWEMTSVLSIGYNGAARGLPNGCERPDEAGNCGCIMHAEINALLKSPYDQPLILFTTHSPCRACTYAILNSKVARVVFDLPYRSIEHLSLFHTNAIAVYARDERGSIGPLFTLPEDHLRFLRASRT